MPTVTLPLLPTSVVGSYPQPEWLVNRQLLAKTVPRTRMRELWRIDDAHIEQAQDDATVLAIRDMERAGIDIISDGEIRRESYSNRFATALEGMDLDNPGRVVGSGGRVTEVPRVVGRIRRTRPVEQRDMAFLRRNTERTAKMTLPGPFTMAKQAQDEFYGDMGALIEDLAAALNEEAHDLQAAGADVIQLDEPWVRNDPEAARRHAVAGIDRALRGLTAATVVHVCFGYAAVVPGESKPSGYSFLPELAACGAGAISIEAAQPELDLGVLRELSGKTVLLGVLDLGRADAESAAEVAERIRRALAFIEPERLIPAPDCGMKYLPREVAFAKLCALAEGARTVRRELAGG